jgi:opacity protein-like surface antigen
MTPHVAAEMTFEWLNGFDPGYGGFPGIDTWSLGVGLRAYLLTGRVQPYGLLGLGVAKGNVEKPSDDSTLQISGTGGELRLGGGVEVYLTDEVVLDLGLAYPFRMGDLEDFDYLTISAGVSYRF